MTTLGTPISPSATRVMLLGSGELGKEVLIALQRLGVETIAVDRYEHAPGQQVAHHARTITMSDPAQLKALIEAERPHLVVPEIEAIATPVLQELEAARRQRSSERATTQAQLAQLRASLAYFESTGTTLAATLRDDSERAYRAGEADYFQFAQGMELMFQLKAEHLRTRYELAITILHLRALQGL